MNEKTLPGLVISDDFKNTGAINIPEGSLAVIVVANSADKSYKAGAVLRPYANDEHKLIMNFISNLGLGLLLAATDNVEETMDMAMTADLGSVVGVTADGEEAKFGAPSVATAPLEELDITKLAKA